jgi:hypothetical protein
MVLFTAPRFDLISLAGVDTVVSPDPLHDKHLALAGHASGVFIYKVPDAMKPAAVQLDSGERVSVNVDRWDSGRIDLSQVHGPGRLDVLDANLPGWTAAVDGKQSPLKTMDGLFKSVDIGPGTHRASMRYRPLSFRFGVFLSALAVAAVVCTLIAGTYKRQDGTGS